MTWKPAEPGSGFPRQPAAQDVTLESHSPLQRPSQAGLAASSARARTWCQQKATQAGLGMSEAFEVLPVFCKHQNCVPKTPQESRVCFHESTVSGLRSSRATG